MEPPDIRVKLTLRASVSPSEDAAKVERALLNLAGSETDEVVAGSGLVTLTSRDPKVASHVRDALRDRHVRSAARRQLMLNTKGRSTWMMFNRQAAAAGVVALCGTPEESPLGPIYAEVESDRLADAIDWLTAYTEG